MARTVLFVSQSVAPVGGVQRWLDQLAAGLPARGWRMVTGLAWGRFHDPAAFERAHPTLDSLRLDGRSGTRAGRLLALETALRRVRPQVVVPLALADAFEALREAKARDGAPRLLYGACEVSAPMLLDVRRYAPLVDHALGVSRLTARLLHTLAGLERERIQHVAPGYALPTRPAVPCDPGGALRLGLVGRLDPDKRPLDLAATLLALDHSGLSWQARVVGAGSLRPALAAACAAWVAAGRLRLEPAADNATLEREVWPQLDALLLFSPAEGGPPNVVAEAMAHGVAVVSADFRGRAVQRLVRHDETALVFAVGDSEGAARHLQALAHDPERRHRLAEAGRREIAQGYTLSGMLDGWAQALEAACEGPPAVGPVPPPPCDERDRLAALFGRRWGEHLRRWLGRGFVHGDASEWPHAGTHDPAALAAAEAHLAGACAADPGPIEAPTQER